MHALYTGLYAAEYAACALRVRELYEFLEEALNDSLFWNVIFMARDINENESNVELMVP